MSYVRNDHMLSWRPTYRSRSSLTVSTRWMCLAHLAGTGPAAPWWLALREEVDDGDEARGGPQSAPGDAGLPRRAPGAVLHHQQGRPHRAPIGYLNVRTVDAGGREVREVRLDPDRC